MSVLNSENIKLETLFSNFICILLVRTSYLSNLTTLRGIAALLVAIFHFEMAIARFVPNSASMFFEKCYLMVDLFFVMSGFILVHVYGTQFKQRVQRSTLWSFGVARFARIYPLHFFSTGLFIVVVTLFSPFGTYPNAMQFPSSMATNIFLLNSFYIHKIYTWNIPSWSISAECLAYALFPFLVIFLAKRRKIAVLIMAAFIMMAYWSIMYLLPRTNPLYPAIPVPHNVNTTYDYGFLRGVAGFDLGMLMYLIYQVPKANRLLSKDWFACSIVVLVILAMHYAINDAFCIILYAALVLCFASNRSKLHLICSNRILQYLGTVSYSIYLMQIFLQDPFSKGWRLPGVTGFGRGRLNISFPSGLIYCLIYLALLIGIASLTYYFVERPSRIYINHKIGHQIEFPSGQTT